MLRKLLNKYSGERNYKIIESPVGELILVASATHLLAILWPDDVIGVDLEKDGFRHNEDHAVLNETANQLEQYFLGERQAFDLPLQPIGTDFQKSVWNALRKIPYGKTLSYSEQSETLGGAKKVRAVAAANGKNPISIVVPCHRVIGKNGKLTGFAGGLDKKEWLLKHEGYLGA